MANMEIVVNLPINTDYNKDMRGMNIEDYVRECESWASAIFGRPYVDKHECAKLIYYMLPTGISRERVLNCDKLALFCREYDDSVETESERRDRWREIFVQRAETGSDPIEMMFADVWRNFTQAFTENQEKRFRQVFVDHVTVLEKRETSTLGTIDEFADIRRKDFGYDLLNMWIEYALELKLDTSPLDHYLVRALHENLSRYMFMVNDVYSFKKEYLDDRAECNYVTLIARLHGCSFQEAVDFVGKQLPALESNIFMYRDEIFALNVPIKAEMITKMVESIPAYNYWHSVSIRYK